MTMRSDAARLALAALLALSPLAAFAHGDTGPNGGQYVHQGAFHVEFLPQGNQLRFLVSDEAEKAVETAGATASLTILENGASRVVQAAPQGKNMVAATLSTPLPKGAKIVVSGRLKDGKTFLARFEVK